MSLKNLIINPLVRIFLAAFTMTWATNAIAGQNTYAIGNVVYGQAFLNQATSLTPIPYLLHVSETLNPGDT